MVLQLVLTPISVSSWRNSNPCLDERGLHCCSPESNCAIPFKRVLQTICGVIPQVPRPRSPMFLPLHI